MFAHRTLTAAYAAAGLLFAVGAGYAEDNEGQAKAEKAVTDFLAEKKVEGPATLITGEALARVFPGDRFFALVFRQYPVARVAPAPFKSQNVLVMPKRGKVAYFTDTRELAKFFKEHAKPVQDEVTAKGLAAAWLALTQTFQQDGFFKFAVP